MKNNCDLKYVFVMVDLDIDVKEVGVLKGDLLIFNVDKVIDVGYLEGMVDNLFVFIKKFGLEKVEIIYVKESFVEKIVRWLMNLVIVFILLIIVFLGLIVEFFFSGVGISGMVGFIVLLLFFYGYFVVGFVGYEIVFFFIVGVIFILFEIFFFGGIIGLLGLGVIIVSLFLVVGSFIVMVVFFLIVLVVFIIVFILLIRVLGKCMKFFKKFVLNDLINMENGYVLN